MHPRQDLTHHPLVPLLLQAGAAVWTQHTRSVNNDLTLVHEQALLDAAAGLVFLRERGFGSIVTARALRRRHAVRVLPRASRAGAGGAHRDHPGRPPGQASRRRDAPGRRRDLPGPAPRARASCCCACIDPSVGDEQDPMSVVPRTRPVQPGQRVRRAARQLGLHRGIPGPLPGRAARPRRSHRRRRPASTWPGRLKHAPPSAPAATRSTAAGRWLRRIITVFRTDADPRTVDLSLDPSERPYGSLFGKRPDLINYGLTGFGRLTTPEAWLSTWSGLSSNADFVRCAPGVTVPTLFIELTGDQAAFPADSRRMTDALGADGSHHRHRPRPALRRSHRQGRARRQRAGRRRDHRLASQTARTHPASLSGCHLSGAE